MKAVGYESPGAADVLVDLEVTDPVASGHDLLIRVKAVSVNPVDYKIRSNRPPLSGGADILGWDAVGVVESVGDAVTLFSPGHCHCVTAGDTDMGG